jgi:hypothetical protein
MEVPDQEAMGDQRTAQLVRVPGSRSPDQFQEVRLAFGRAARLPPQCDPAPTDAWRVGICNAAGQLAAHGTLRSFDQVCSFALALEETGGYRAVLFAEVAVPFGCDLVLQPVELAESRPAPLLQEF